MPHDIAPRKTEYFDSFNVVEYGYRLHKPAFAHGGKVDLGDIAGDDSLAVVPQAGEEHFHLFRRGVLCLVENYKRIVERSAAHICERDYLHNALFTVSPEAFGAEHFAQCIVKRAEVGIDLILEITGKKAELFARFHRRARENDPADLLGFERRYRHCDGKEGFARSGGTDTEYNGVFCYGIDIFLLADCLCLDRLAAIRERQMQSL